MKLNSSSSIKDKYSDAVLEGNKVMTSQPVTIEKAPPGEDPFLNRDEDEDFKVTVSSYSALLLVLVYYWFENLDISHSIIFKSYPGCWCFHIPFGLMFQFSKFNSYITFGWIIADVY